MHGVIFQISYEEISKEDYIDEEKLAPWLGTEFDYCYQDKLDEETRKTAIDNLLDELPSGMFEAAGKDAIKYNGGMDEWKKNFVSEIKKKAGEIDEKNCMNWFGEVFFLKNYIENPLGINCKFFINENLEMSYGFLNYVDALYPGILLHVGGIVVYHF